MRNHILVKGANISRHVANLLISSLIRAKVCVGEIRSMYAGVSTAEDVGPAGVKN